MNPSEVMPRYAIRGGKEGKERLNLLARVMLPTTSQLLKKVGFRKRMTCLDVGCGGGHVTLLMASMVGPKARSQARTRMNRLSHWRKKAPTPQNWTTSSFVREMPAPANGTKSMIWLMRVFYSLT